MDDTLDSWLDKEITDAENVVGMYRSYRNIETEDGIRAVARLYALRDVRKKIEALWGIPPRS